MSLHSVGRRIARQAIREGRQRSTGRRIQREAAARPESQRVETPYGTFWMSPIETKLYEAMRQEGLSPAPQFRIEAYYVDFAFPDLKVAVEADGAAYHSGERMLRDRRRDSFLRGRGWIVKRFYGTTIHNRAANCAYVVKRELQDRQRQAVARAQREEAVRRERREAIARPFRRIAGLLRREKKG